jgi:hypothetical protein
MSTLQHYLLESAICTTVSFCAAPFVRHLFVNPNAAACGHRRFFLVVHICSTGMCESTFIGPHLRIRPFHVAICRSAFAQRHSRVNICRLRIRTGGGILLGAGSLTDNRWRRMAPREESPGSTGQGCWITSSQRELKDSATETDRRWPACRHRQGWNRGVRDHEEHW